MHLSPQCQPRESARETMHAGQASATVWERIPFRYLEVPNASGPDVSATSENSIDLARERIR